MDEKSRNRQVVSELLESGAPNKSLLNPLFALYNLLTIAFGIRLFAQVRAETTQALAWYDCLILVVVSHMCCAVLC